MAISLKVLQAVQALVDDAYQKGWDDCRKAGCSTGDLAAMQPIKMTSEVDATISYRDRFLGGLWPTDVSADVKAVPLMALNLNVRVLNAIRLAITPVDDPYRPPTIGRILEASPADMMRRVQVRRGLGEKGIKQLLDALGKYGVKLQYPSV